MEKKEPTLEEAFDIAIGAKECADCQKLRSALAEAVRINHAMKQERDQARNSLTVAWSTMYNMQAELEWKDERLNELQAEILALKDEVE